jgi:hypothetical protein
MKSYSRGPVLSPADRFFALIFSPRIDFCFIVTSIWETTFFAAAAVGLGRNDDHDASETIKRRKF